MLLGHVIGVLTVVSPTSSSQRHSSQETPSQYVLNRLHSVVAHVI